MRKEISDLTMDQLKQITKKYGCASITDVGTCEKLFEVTDKGIKACLFRKGSHLIVAFFLLQAGSSICYSKSLLSLTSLSRVKTLVQDQTAS